MDEILKKLFASNVLSEETKVELQEQFKAMVSGYLTEERAKLEQEVTTKLTEEFVRAQEQLVEAMDIKIDDFLKTEFAELHEDVDRFRDLEVEHAEKLVEEKANLASQLNEELTELVDKLDAFLEVRLSEEMDELKEDIAEVKKLQFGQKIFEAMEAEFRKVRGNDVGTLEHELAEAQDRLADANQRLKEMRRGRIADIRESKLNKLLAPLSGIAREQMRIILESSTTEKLDETYKVYLSRVLKESTVAAKPESKKLTESQTRTAESVLVTGNDETKETLIEGIDQLSRLRKLAGLA
jgi:methionyl-tRNA synthetase